MKTILGVISFLEGKKTYIVAFLVAMVSFAMAMGWIDTSLATALDGLLGAGGLVSLRMAVAKTA